MILILKIKSLITYYKYLIKRFLGNIFSIWHPSLWIDVHNEKELNDVVRKNMDDSNIYIDCSKIKFPTSLLIGKGDCCDFRKIHILYSKYINS